MEGVSSFFENRKRWVGLSTGEHETRVCSAFITEKQGSIYSLLSKLGFWRPLRMEVVNMKYSRRDLRMSAMDHIKNSYIREIFGKWILLGLKDHSILEECGYKDKDKIESV